MCSTTYAASFGHSRIVSALGQPLGIDVPVSQLTPDDLKSLNVSAAPASAWVQAGLTPPVNLDSISLHLADGYAPNSKVIQLRSTEPFDGPVADLLLDVRTASGQQRFQVSLLTHASQDAIHAAGGVSQGPRVGAAGSPAGQETGQRMLRGMIRVKKGDTMFAIARRHAVPGVTVYQMMMALQRANPQAFIQGNINLVKAGAALAMPDMAGLTAISDKEARRLFAKQAQAFALYRQRLAASTSAVAKEGSASQGVVTAAGQPEPTQAAPAPEDQLRLSRGQASPAASASGITGTSGGSGNAAGGSAAVGSTGGANASNDADVRADDSVAARKEIGESKERVSQLEENVKHLNEALQSQGGAASDLIVDGAKGLGQSLADVANAVTSPGGSGAAPASNGSASGSSTPAQGQGSSNAGNPTGSTAVGNGSAADGTSSAASTQGSAAGSGSAASGASAAESSTAGGSTAGGSTAGASTDNGSATGGSSAKASEATGSAANGSAADGAAGSGSAASGSNASTANGAAGNATSATSPSTTGGKPGEASTGAPVAGTPAAGAPAAGTAGSNAALAPSASGSAGAPGSAATDNAAGNAGKAGGDSSTAASGTAPAAGLASAAKNAGSGANDGAPNRADQTQPSSGADRAGDVSEPISTRAEQTVSWIQEHMLGVITGLLALIVLVIAWLLRRANSGRDDGRADNSGLITEAMVREKLDQINLDLSQSSADDASSRRR